MPRERSDRLAELGAFIREQRENARLSVRRLSELADVSNPYLSQIERGLRRPSAEILQQIAKGLKISAETLYVRAGILDPQHHEGLEDILPSSRLGSLPELSDAEIGEVAVGLTEYERKVSARRRAILDVLDRLQDEIVRRYQTGEATVDNLLP